MYLLKDYMQSGHGGVIHFFCVIQQNYFTRLTNSQLNSWGE